jgi:hypothetical protein
MYRVSGAALGVFCLLTAGQFVSSGAGAQTITADYDLSLKNGETLELTDAYLISRDCKSLLKSPPEVTILEGPPGVVVSMNEAMVTPFSHNCARPVRGGKVAISARDVEFYSHTTLVLRYRYKTPMGDRFSSARYRLTVYP